MEKPGEKLNPKFWTFKYANREPKHVKEFLVHKPEMEEMYIYDVCLSTGTLLYSCKGGMGVTKEPYIVDMHRFIKSSTCESTLRTIYQKIYREKPTKRAYLSLREKFNIRESKLLSFSHCAELYCLWLGSGYFHKYRYRGYDAAYFPTLPNYLGIGGASLLSREKNLLFRKEDLLTFSESIITDQTVVYMHLPLVFGVYGAGFLWNKPILKFYVKSLNELSELGYKVCVSAQYASRGQLTRDFEYLFPGFKQYIVPQFKGTKLTFNTRHNSEIYLYNF